MGCASSKPYKSKCNHCKAPNPAVSRSYSMFVHHPPSKEGDSYHMVALTSSTLGSLRLDQHSSSSSTNPVPHFASFNARLDVGKEAFQKKKIEKAELEVDMMEAKAWSKMIDEKMVRSRAPQTPVRTPPGEPETINAWEMMEGLEDTSPLEPESESDHHLRSFSFHVSPPNEMPDSMELSPPPIKREREREREKENDDAFVLNGKEMAKTMASEFDTEVISAFRKALGELSPSNPFRLSKYPQILHDDDEESNVDRTQVLKKVNGGLEKGRVKERLVLYFTSLRGIRKTYEDCCAVKLIFKGLGVKVDERDVSMHSAFKEELRELLGEAHNGGGGLPRVFLGDKYIGGADEIRRMHDEGSLEKVLEWCEFVHGSIGGGGCEACGDIRFVPCETCSGSCKIYYEVEEEEVDAEEEGGGFGFQRCPDCNENGLIRCPVCCR